VPQDGPDAIPDLPVDDRRVQAVVDLSLVPEPSNLAAHAAID
jgi:hypothetical protein